MNFHFIASNQFDLKNFTDLERFVRAYPDFQTITLNNESELNVLLGLISIQNSPAINLNCLDFSKYWNLSDYLLPEFNEEQFNHFYSEWLKISQRPNNMDEFGNLIFLSGLSSDWNKRNFRMVVLDKD